MDRQERREEMQRHIAAWRTSGKTQKQYCEECGEALSVLQYWIRKEREETTIANASFAQVVTSGVSAQLEIVYPNGVALRLPPGTDVRLVRQFLSL